MTRHHRPTATGTSTLLADLQERLARVRAGGGERARERHLARGKLLPRDRVERLCDPGAPFLELSPLAAEELYDGAAPGAGMVAGDRHASAGAEVVVVANDATVKGGTYYPMTVKKHLRAQEVALHNRLPCVYLVDSGGAFLPMQDEVFPDREHFGRIFFNQATMSARAIPQIACVMGSCTAGGAYVPGDERRDGDRPRAGHDLPRRPAAGEGGDRRGASPPRSSAAATCTRGPPASSTTSPTTTSTRWRSCGAIVATLPAEPAAPWERRAPRPPLEDPATILDVVPTDSRTPYDVREIMQRLVDGGELQEFKELYGTTVVCAFGHLDGHPVGIIANNGILFSESALKAAHFVELCDRRGDPAAVLAEHHGLHGRHATTRPAASPRTARSSSPRSRARACRSSPSSSAAPSAPATTACAAAPTRRASCSCGRTRASRVMGGEQAATVMTEVGQPETGAALREQYERQGRPTYSTARLWDDGIIDPRETRAVLGPVPGGLRQRAAGGREQRDLPDVNATPPARLSGVGGQE